MSVSIKIRPLAAALAVATVLACGMTAADKSAFGEEGNENEATRADTSSCIVGSSTFASCFPDYNLAAQVAERVKPEAKTPEDIMSQADVDGLTRLYAEGVSNLEGIENLTALTDLTVAIGGITDLTPLDNPVLAQNITELELDENEITDISPLRNYTNLEYINLKCNHISDLSPLKDLHPHTLKASDQHIFLGREDIRSNPDQAVSMPFPIDKDGVPVTPTDIEPMEGLEQNDTELIWSAPAAGGPRSFNFDGGDNLTYLFDGSVQLEVVTAEPRLVTFTPLQPVDPQPTTGQRVAHGLTATKPDDPVCPGYRFVGWFPSPGVGGERFDFEKPIVENIPLYGRWVSDTDDSGNSQDESTDGSDAGDNQTPLPELEKVVCEPGTSTYTQCFPDENLAEQLASKAWKYPEDVLTQDDIDREFADSLVLIDAWNLNGLQILKNIKSIVLDYNYSQGQSAVDLRPLSELTEITSFLLTGTTDENTTAFPLVTDFTPLSKLVKMETITINTAGLENVNGFESFTGMTKLNDIDLCNNRISDLRSMSALGSLPLLSGIDLRGNAILDASPLKPFEQSPAYISISDQEIIVGRHELPDTTLALSLPTRPDGKYVFNGEENIHSISDKGHYNSSNYEVVWDVPVQDTVHSYEFWDEGYQEGSWYYDGIVTDRPADDVSGRDIYQIHFDLGTAPTLSRIPNQLVYSGNLASKVPDPIRYKHDFDGWYMENTPDPTDEDEDDMPIWPWNRSGTGDVLTRNLAEPGDVLTRNLRDSSDSDSTAGGGSADSGTAADEVLFDFASTRVKKDIELTARWTPLYILTFDSQGGSAVSSQSVRADQAPNEPAAPTRTGYTFQGWSTAAQNGTPVDFTQHIGQDTTVYAQWAPVTTPVNPTVPDTPTTPVNPDTSVNPGAPVTSDTPVNPGTPQTPDNPLVSGNSTSQISTDSPVSRMTTGKYVTTSRGSRLGTLASTGSDLLGLMFAALVIVLCCLGCQAHLRSRRSSVPR